MDPGDNPHEVIRRELALAGGLPQEFLGEVGLGPSSKQGRQAPRSAFDSQDGLGLHTEGRPENRGREAEGASLFAEPDTPGC
jgi:hypothetical protein